MFLRTSGLVASHQKSIPPFFRGAWRRDCMSLREVPRFPLIDATPLPKDVFLDELSKLRGEERFVYSARQSIAKRWESFLATPDRCPVCWMNTKAYVQPDSPSLCHCTEVAEMSVIPAKSHVWIYFHHSEIGRSTNSAISLLQTLENVSVIYYGVPEQEKMMIDVLNSALDRSFVLYPDKNSTSVRTPQL